MPLFRIGDKLHYYAHVPKCGGSSVESYLKDRFGALAFLNTRFTQEPEAGRWTKSSPQHLPLAAFSQLVPPDWIASSFAVVRHPMKRLVSAFRFQIEVERTVAPLWSIDEWFDDYLKRVAGEPYLYDNHLCPQSKIVPEAAAIFRLEDGLDPIVAHLDRLAGDTGGPRSIPAENVRKKGHGPDAERLQPSAETIARVNAYYAEDYARFGYDTDRAPKSAPHGKPGARGVVARIAGALTGRRG